MICVMLCCVLPNLFGLIDVQGLYGGLGLDGKIISVRQNVMKVLWQKDEC